MYTTSTKGVSLFNSLQNLAIISKVNFKSVYTEI